MPLSSFQYPPFQRSWSSWLSFMILLSELSLSHLSARSLLKNWVAKKNASLTPKNSGHSNILCQDGLVLFSHRISELEKPLESLSPNSVILQMVNWGTEKWSDLAFREETGPALWPQSTQPNVLMPITAASFFFLLSVASEQEGFKAVRHDLMLLSPFPACCSCIQLQIWPDPCWKGSLKVGKERERNKLGHNPISPWLLSFSGMETFIQGWEVEVEAKQEPWRQYPGKGVGTWQHH